LLIAAIDNTNIKNLRKKVTYEASYIFYIDLCCGFVWQDFGSRGAIRRWLL